MSLLLNPDAQIILGPEGATHARIGGRLFSLEGIPAEILRALAEAADGIRTRQEIALALSRARPTARVEEVLAALTQAGVLLESGRSEERSAGGGSVVLLGNRRLFRVLRQALHAAGFHPRAVRLRSFESCRSSGFLALQRQWICGGRGPDADAGDPVTPASLRLAIHGADLVICALESVPYRALLDVNAAALECQTPCLFVTASPESATVGPTVVSGSTACFWCRAVGDEGIPSALHATLPHFLAPAAAGAPDAHLAAVAAAVVEEAASVVGPLRSPALAATILRISSRGERVPVPLLPLGDCPECATARRQPRAVDDAAGLSVAIQVGRTWPVSPVARDAGADDAYRSVVILGGGTAGYLAALALRAKRPELEVTVVESSKIPVIGVGEATTPELVKFLHSPRFLGLDIVDFYERVRPSWKLGIRFQWGLPPPYDFTFPFQRGRLLESQLHGATINDQSLAAMLMVRDRVPVFAGTEGRPFESLLHLVRFAYHLDNRRLIRYLQEKARDAGIHHVDAVVTDARIEPGGGEVTGLCTDDGRVLSFDLYVDCSGFRSLLLEKKLGSPFQSYDTTLFTDHAIAADVPHDGTVKPYTLAETMDCGWCWNIPFEDSDHRGYVFCSAFTGIDQAIDEMRSKNPGMGNPWVVKFRSGRHEHFWKGNVVALGNAYAFVEPLESTALHLLVLQIELLVSNLPSSRRDEAIKSVLNRKIGARWDALRWFLGIHYKFNRRVSTRFWEAARAGVDISGAGERVALFRERAPLSYRDSLYYTVFPPEFFSDDHSFDTLLAGQQVPARWVRPVETEATWRRLRASQAELAARALPLRDVLRWLREERPDVLRDFVAREESWLHTWVPA